MKSSFLPVAAAVLLPAALAARDGRAAEEVPLFVYVGTYTGGESEGIYLFQMDPEDGKWEPKGLAAEVENPSFVALHPERPLLYSAGNATGPDGKPQGMVSAFSIDPASGKLTLLNRQPSGGAGPCHVSVDPAGAVVLVANYGDGSVAAFPLQGDGRLGTRGGFAKHEGSGPNRNRQKGPHAHCIFADPSGRFALAVDLGIDRVRVYKLGPGGELSENDPPEASLHGGAGPRHLAFHPHKPFAYVINELDSTLSTFRFDPQSGELRELATTPTVPDDFTGTNWPAEVLAHPSGRFLYGSNRGHDSIVAYRIADDGTPETIGHEPTRGKTPRNFGIDPGGRFLFVANQESHEIVAFEIDAQTGELSATGETYMVNTPSCVRFWRAPRPDGDAR